jgi:predicted TIM-barrel fold metal-dependent hydrolase
MQIIDVHHHVFPQNVFDKIWAYFDKHHWPIVFRQGEAERAALIEKNTEYHTTLCYAHRVGMAAWLNNYVLDYAAAHPKAIPTGTFHPDDPDVLQYVEEGLKRGLKGFKMHLEVQRFNPADPRLEKVYALLTEAGVPNLVHTAGAPLEGPWTGPQHFANMLAMAPRMNVIVAHMGGVNHFEYFRYAGDYPLYFDTAMVGVDYPGFGFLDAEICAHIAKHSDRFLFGSDFPSIPYPWQHQVDVVKSWGLGEAGERKVFFENAARLYRVAATPGEPT